MSKPLILVTAGRRNEATPRTEIQTVITGCNVHYTESVVRAGGAPLIVPRMADADALQSVMAAADGLLLTGGGDVVSLLYGEEPHPRSLYQDPVRDEMEMMAARLALERDLPILGICRGIQLLNVALGGTLIQDVPTQVPGALNHNVAPQAPVLVHTIDIEEDSLLARVVQTTSMPVNSYHHQAIKDLGRGLRVNCRTRDGVIEGVEAADGRPILAVQFHPEEHTATHPRLQAIFDWLVRAASGRAEAPASEALAAV